MAALPLRRSRPDEFGHGEQASGLWFVRVNVVRDHHSVNGRETSDWDTWRQATAIDHTLSDAECAQTDELTANPEASSVAPSPPWLRR